MSLTELAERQPDLTFYETHTRYPFDHPLLALAPGWVNFSPVEVGSCLTHRDADPSEFSEEEQKRFRYAEIQGALLFPKYPPRDSQGNALLPHPKELCRIITPLKEHPLQLWSSPPSIDQNI